MCRVVFIVRSSLTAYSFAKAQLFRLKLFHARHFPQAVFHPLLFSSSLPFCFKTQPKISAVSENEVREWYCCIIAEQENFGDGTIFGNLECSDLKSGGWAVTWRSVSQVLTLPKMSALHGGHVLVGLAPAWESQLILRCFFWDVQESLSLSWKDFVQKKVSLCTNSVWHWTHSKAKCGRSLYLCTFFPLFCCPKQQIVESTGQIQANLRVGGKVAFRNSFKSL